METSAVRRVRVAHSIRARFAEAADGAELSIKLTPRELARQRVEHHRVDVTPRPAEMKEGFDASGNHEVRVDLRSKLRSIDVDAVSTLVMRAVDVSEDARGALRDRLRRANVPIDSPGERRVEPGLCRALAEDALRRLREAGVACRYVAGYPVPTRRGRSLPHAWISVDVGEHGVVDFDPTSGAVAPGHVVIGWGERYEDVAPFGGALFGAGRYSLASTVFIEPLDDVGR